LTTQYGQAVKLSGAVAGPTLVSYPSGSVRGTSPVIAAVPVPGERIGIITERTPFHPVDHMWPDQPADLGTIIIDGAAFAVVDCVLGASPEGSGECLLGTDIPVRRGAEGWIWFVVHVAQGPAVSPDELVGKNTELRPDPERRAGLSSGHTACELVTLAVNRVFGDWWSKPAETDPLGSPNFDRLAITSSRIGLYRARDEYRLGKSLRKKGFAADRLTADLDAAAAAISTVMNDWVTAAAPVSVVADGPELTAFRTWRCALPEAQVVVPCGGTHVNSTADLGPVTVSLALDSTGTALTMLTTTTAPRVG
jgi:alanyl-tRNA synthetase